MPGTAKSVRKSWVERQRIQDTEDVVAGSSSSDMSSTNIDSRTMDELIEFISSSDSDNIDGIYLRRAIELASRVDGIVRQKDVLTACMRKLLRGKDPKEQQVRCLRRLVFGIGDTLLIAKTGFGKSIIFHAYSILTGKITIQLVPLSKLGEEQTAQVNTYGVSGTKACLVSHDTKHKNPALVSEIRRRDYTHIITSPEQIAMDWFLELVREVDFRDHIGLVAIDECHLVSTWASFREAYAEVFTLRTNLLPSVIWFGCTATLTRKQEAEVLKFGGFRREGRGPGELQIIRTSTDRPEISLHFLPIPPKKHASLQCLHPLLDEAVRCTESTVLPEADEVASSVNAIIDPSNTTQSTTGKELTPQNIPKTILFVDGRTKVTNVVQAMIDQLVLMGYSVPLASNTVEGFHSFTPAHDKDRILDEFRKPDSEVRILVATTAVGLGMNLPDVERVVVYGLLITMELSDLMQRIGRAARAASRTGDAIIFLPYWLFWDYGEDKSGQVPLLTGKGKKRGKKKSRNKPVHGKAAGGLQDGQDSNAETAAGEESDAVSSYSGPRQMSGHDIGNEMPATLSGRWCEQRRYWTADEREKRAKVGPEWFEVVNAECHRRTLLEYFREEDVDNRTREGPPPPGHCCNGSDCERRMTSYDSWPLREPRSVAPSGNRKPNSGTLADIALGRIKQWCAEHAADLAGPQFFGDAPAWLVMPSSLQLKVANLFKPPPGRKKKNSSPRCPINSINDLREILSPADWGAAAKYEQEFVDFLVQEFPAIQEAHAAVKAKSKATGTIQRLDTTEADDLAKLDAELARNPDDVRVRDSVDNQQSMMAAMFRRRHGQAIRGLTMRQSSAIVPPVLGKGFTPTEPSPLRTIVSANEGQVDAAAGGKVGGDEGSDPTPGENSFENTSGEDTDIATGMCNRSWILMLSQPHWS